MKQFGAIIGDKAVIGSNTCLNPGSLIGKESWLVSVPYWTGFLPSKKFVKGKLDYEILDKKD